MTRAPIIESVQSLVLGNAHFVRVQTDTGLEGVGQSACWAYPQAVHGLVEAIAPNLVGQAALRTEHLWQFVYRTGPFRGSVLGGAVSAIDIALWDIKGQHYGAPIWDLLGGRCRDKIRLHLLILEDLPPEGLAEAVQAGVAKGFTAIKFDPIPARYGDSGQDALVRAIEARVEAARDAAGADVDLILELHRKLTPVQMLGIAPALARFNVLALEDPIQIDSIQSQADLVRRLPQAMAGGERLNTIWEFKELLTQGGPQFVRPDLGLAGGISHVKKIAALAEAHHASIMPHNFLGPVLTAAALHLDASVPNVATQEYTLSDETDWANAIIGLPKRDGGYMPLPEAPGLGVRILDEAAAAAVTTPTLLTEPPLRADGSIALSV